ncbi:MAG: phosphonate metabolism protein/1,5-bisphosphokinase (PRPP-forming) PhnN [Pelistega sp.]|nr:phosphonate metabolism protein/1,5-bisphosphokinase (PRPP-forming) PhnN [Pelistega sp.]
MAGQLIYVVGPSGSGKDSIIQALAEQTEVTVMRRVITREPDSIGEDADSVDIETFDQMEAEGKFSMSWRANGLSYGIPLSLDEHLQTGQVVVVNGSRKYCETLNDRYPDALVVLVTVDPSLLRQRLQQRNRETSLEIEHRLQRNALFEQTLLSNFSQWQLRFFMLDNSGELTQTIEQFHKKLAFHLRIPKTAHMG